MKDKLKYIIAGVLLFCISFVGGCYVGDIKTAEASNDEDRFKFVYNQRMGFGNSRLFILHDTEEGVQYLILNCNGTSTTVLVDADGKPLVSK